jgi:hypothetical protein
MPVGRNRVPAEDREMKVQPLLAASQIAGTSIETDVIYSADQDLLSHPQLNWILSKESGKKSFRIEN